jgi:hypothetical protein
MPRHIAYSIEHALIGDALFLQPLHQPLPRPRRCHADAAEARPFRETTQA